MLAAVPIGLAVSGCAAVPSPAPAPVAAPVVEVPAPPPVAVAQTVAAPAPAPRQVPRDTTAEASAGMLAYADRMRSLSSVDLLIEINRLADIPDNARAPAADLQLAIALGQTHVSNDLQRAMPMLQRVMNNPREEARPLQPLARLLASRYVDQRRSEEQLDRANQQLRDSQRRIEQLNDRLEAVRAIERSMNARPPAAGAASAPAPRTSPP